MQWDTTSGAHFPESLRCCQPTHLAGTSDRVCPHFVGKMSGRRFSPKIAFGTPDVRSVSSKLMQFSEKIAYLPMVSCAEYRARLLEKIAYLTVSSQTRN